MTSGLVCEFVCLCVCVYMRVCTVIIILRGKPFCRKSGQALFLTYPRDHFWLFSAEIFSFFLLGFSFYLFIYDRAFIVHRLSNSHNKDLIPKKYTVIQSVKKCEKNQKTKWLCRKSLIMSVLQRV